jgi:steroid 5-alpha reductase family enzyme
MSLTETLVVNGTIVLSLLTLLWIVSLLRQDAGIIDPFWGFGFVVIAWVTWSRTSEDSIRNSLLVVLTTVWGLRLSLFLLMRNAGHAEDYRYRAMRNHHGKRFWWVSFLTVFLLQGVIMLFVSLPLQVAMISADFRSIGTGAPGATANPSTPLWLLDWCGVTIWAIGVFFESVGDLQLKRFRANTENHGRVLDTGLWRYTRHPNYFGDFCVWWGLWIVAASGGAWWTIVSPLLMSFLLLKVSGVSLLEKTITERRPAYAEYIRRTNAFFPGPPRGKSMAVPEREGEAPAEPL